MGDSYKLMDLKMAPESTQFEIWAPKYKDKRPPDRVVIASDGNNALVIAYIGPALDYWMDHIGDLEAFVLDPGVWIAHADVRDWKDDWTGEYDCELELTNERPLTPQEWEMLQESPEEGPWAEKDWLLNPRCDNEGPSDLPEGW